MSRRALFAPGKASSAGGVAWRAEMLKTPAAPVVDGRWEVDRKLQHIKSIHHACVHYGEENGRISYVKGANIAGFVSGRRHAGSGRGVSRFDRENLDLQIACRPSSQHLITLPPSSARPNEPRLIRPCAHRPDLPPIARAFACSFIEAYVTQLPICTLWVMSQGDHVRYCRR